MNIGIVVSRFNEVPDVYCKIFDLIQTLQFKKSSDFLREKGFFSKTSLYFYNKGKSLEPEDIKRLQSYGFKSVDYIELPNVGREAHTMIYHMRSMISESSKTSSSKVFEDLIYFIPASFSRKLKSSSDLKDPKKVLTSDLKELYTEDAVVQTMIRNIILVNNPCHFSVEAGFLLDDWKGTDPDNLKDTVKQTYSLAKIRPFGAWFQNKIFIISESSEPKESRVLHQNQRFLYLHGWGNGLMGFLQTSRDRIMKYDLKFYEECEKELEESGENGELPHYWERSWATLFGIPRI